MAANVHDLSPDRWAQARALFEGAIGLPSNERAAYLDEHCGADRLLHETVAALLEADAAPRVLLDASPEDLSRLLTGDEANLECVPRDLVDRYTIERELGRGGMATVYLAHDQKHDRKVALKVLQPELARAIRAERFVREIRIAAQLTHPHIVPLHDSGEVEGILYYVMPYVEGESLRDRLSREKQLPVEDALRIARDVAAALSYAHSQGVVHRDIKPGNILLAPGGEAVVADFGIARALTEAGGPTVTETGVAVGTPAYMSPEQGAGSSTINAQSDIYSLGCVLYEMLAGHPPYTGATAQELLARHALDPVPSLRAARTTVPETVEQVIARALAKQPVDRFATAAEFAAALVRPGASLRRRRARRLVYAVAGVSALVGGSALVARSLLQWAPPQQSVAVVPFANLSAEPESSEYFSAGITEELINALAQVPGLRVPAATSAFALKGRGLSVRQIADTLRVATVLEGSVRRAGTGVRITAQLINAADGYHLWSSSYDREIRGVRDVLDIQNEIAHAIVGALRIKLGGADTMTLVRRSTDDAEAYDLYLRGRYVFARRSGPELQKAIAYFSRAVERDPSYALALSGLADAYEVAASGRVLDPEVVFPRARAAALKALALDSSIAEAHASLGRVLADEWDLAGAEHAFRRAISLNPGYALAHSWYAAWLLSPLGRFDEAVREARLGVELDPLAPAMHDHLGIVLLHARRYDEAIAEFRWTLEFLPDYAGPHRRLAWAYRATGMPEQALVEYETALKLNPKRLEILADIGSLYATTGRRSEAIKILERLQMRSNVEETNMAAGDLLGGGLAGLYLVLGDKDSALAVLERGFDRRPSTLRSLKVSPTWDPLRREPRFRALLRKMRLES